MYIVPCSCIEWGAAGACCYALQGLLGPGICQQLGSEALDSAVTQMAGLLPRDLQALAADAAAAAAARGLKALDLLPKLKALPASSPHKLLQPSSQADEEPDSLGELGLASGEANLQLELAAPLSVCEEDVQVSLDRVRKRTATVIGAPKVRVLLKVLVLALQ